MHEFSLCQNIAKIVSTNSKKENKTVKKVVLKVGDLAGVDAESLCFWFPVAIKNTDIKNTKLELVHEKGHAKCLDCSHEFKLTQLYQACSKCGSFNKDIIKGQELLVQSIIYN